MVDTGKLMNDSPASPLGRRRKSLEKWLDYGIEQGWTNFSPPDGGYINDLDIKLLKPYAESCGLEIKRYSTNGIAFTASTKKVEEEEWAKEFTPKKANWFVLWVNRLLYRINR